ncbi:unnamed protein product [Caenorhabditis brenneri]
MSLSRPARFPLLKLPWLCIKCILYNSDLFDIIFFVSLSNRTRRLVKSLNYPLKEIEVSLSRDRKIRIGDTLEDAKYEKTLHFTQSKYAFGIPHWKASCFLDSSHSDFWGGHYLESYTVRDTLDALKTAISFFIDEFECTIRNVIVDGDKLSELMGLGISSVKELIIRGRKPVKIANLNYILEHTKVTDKYVFDAPIPKDFSCDPQIFKCRRLSFWHSNATDWVTLEFLCQLDLPELYFLHHRFSVEDVVSFITYWFNSENRKLEYLYVNFKNPVSLWDFKIEHLNPMQFCEKRRNKCLFVNGWAKIDMSSGKDILRQDGLLATFYVDFTSVIFHVWHKRFPDAVQQ